LGGISRYEYTHFDLLASHTGPDGARHEFRHDTELRLTGVVNPQGLTWSYEYDPAGNLAAETDFDGRRLAYTYDAAGRLASRTDALRADHPLRAGLPGTTDPQGRRRPHHRVRLRPH
jgi:YD repeat-containing protein